jgi:hypothetical protein
MKRASFLILSESQERDLCYEIGLDEVIGNVHYGFLFGNKPL